MEIEGLSLITLPRRGEREGALVANKKKKCLQVGLAGVKSSSKCLTYQDLFFTD